MRVLSVRRGWFSDTAVFVADTMETCRCGTRVYWCPKNRSVEMSAPKKWLLEAGQEVPLYRLVKRRANKFCWRFDGV